ncbi:MAG: hypothetical protein KGQ93_09910 [Cyanobacteria bacterium REEB459]|nr:hypothetical protein [Cyanobacteria bacterium REEB459]
MLFLLLAIVIVLVAWALRLMDQAVRVQEFSLMLAGFLVASSAAAIVGVYFLMGNYRVYIHQQSAQVNALPAPEYALPYTAASLGEIADLPATWVLSSD